MNIPTNTNLESVACSFTSDDGVNAVIFKTVPVPSHVDIGRVFLNVDLVREIPRALGARALYIFVGHELNPELPDVITSRDVNEATDPRKWHGSIAGSGEDLAARIDIDPRFDFPFRHFYEPRPGNATYANLLRIGILGGGRRIRKAIGEHDPGKSRLSEALTKFWWDKAVITL